MHLKRFVGVAGAIAAAAIAIAPAGAAPSAGAPTTPKAPKVHFKTPAAVLKYLERSGINTSGFVVQRGVRNYAGPSCPGKRWRCTSARRVVQFAGNDGFNSFSCSPSYGATPPITPTPVSSPPGECVIVQVGTTGNNNAKCIEITTANPAAQHCQVHQVSTTGTNNSTIVQVITQRSGQQQTATQNAEVSQDSGSGGNNSWLTQTIVQWAATGGPAVDQDQNADQDNSIDQNSATGTTFSTMSQAVFQKEWAGRIQRDDDDSHTYSVYGPTTLTGSQDQDGDGESDTNQSTAGIAKSFNFQNMLQVAMAPKWSAVSQDQNGPFRCCTFQGSNPNDVFFIEQAKFQFTSSAAASQFLSSTGELETSGDGHIRQIANQNGDAEQNSCDVSGGVCVAQTTCAAGSEEGGCTEPFSCSSDSDEECSIPDGDGCGCDCELCLSSNRSATKAKARAARPQVALRRHHFRR